MPEIIDFIANKVSFIAQLLECDVFSSDRQFARTILIYNSLG